MEEKEITIKLSVMMERLKKYTADPVNMLATRLNPIGSSMAILIDIFREHQEDIEGYLRMKANEERMRDRAN